MNSKSAWRKIMNPIDWAELIYSKGFPERPVLGFFVVLAVLVMVLSLVVGGVWWKAIDNVKSNQQAAKQQELEALGSLMNQGTHLYIASQKKRSVLPAYYNWEQRLTIFLERSLNKGYASRMSTAGIDRLVPLVPNPENQLVIGMTERYRSALDEFMKEIGQANFWIPIKLDQDILKLIDRTEFDTLLNPPQKKSTPPGPIQES